MKHFLIAMILVLTLSESSGVRADFTPKSPAMPANVLGEWTCWDDGSVNPCHSTLNSIDLVSSTDGWAVGDDGLILRWDGENWTRVQGPIQPSKGSDYRSVSMVSATDGWIAENSGHLLHWNGAAWTVFATIGGNAIEMISSTDGWLASTGGLYHWDGVTWKWVSAPIYEIFSSLSILNPNCGWAVGFHGAIIRWDGLSWQPVVSPTGMYLGSVEVVSENEVYVGGETLFHLVGTDWTVVSGVSPFSVYAIAMNSSTSGWAAGVDGFSRYEAPIWRYVKLPTNNVIRDISIVADDDAWAVGEGGVILRWNGTDWLLVTHHHEYLLNAVKMLDANNGWAVGANGTILRWNGSTWSKTDFSFNTEILSIDALSMDDAWISTPSYTYHWDGISWTRSTPLPPLYDLDMVSASSVWASGFGVVYHWDGAQWVNIPVPDNWLRLPIDMLDDSNGWVISYTALRWDGSSWERIGIPSYSKGGHQIRDIEMIDANDGWAVGGTSPYHWDGTAWQYDYSGRQSLEALSLVSKTDIWAAGYDSITHWDGFAWTAADLPVIVGLEDIDMVDSSDGWAVGRNGVIMRFTPSTISSFFFPIVSR
jgi:hypothetical protein